MTNHIKLLSLFLLFVSMILSGRNFAQPMKLVSASDHQFLTPVLKGKEANQVIQIKIETEGDKNPISLSEVKLKLSGTDIQNDIEEVSIFYTEENPFLEDGIRFGIPEKPQQQITFAGNLAAYPLIRLRIKLFSL